MAQGWREPVLRAARSLGVEKQLRRAQRAMLGPTDRRNARDDEHLQLTLSLSLPADATCVDVGANVGGMLETMVRLAPQGRHVAFEPLPELAADLRRRFPQAEVHEAAVADAAGRLTFHRAVGAPSRSSLHRHVLEGHEVEELEVAVAVLDEVIPPGDTVDLLKIDVEGGELAALRGAARILREDRPLVVLEHGGPSDHSPAIHGLLSGAGLRIFDMDGGGPYDLPAFLTALEGRRRRWNWVAHR